ncbi:heavy metal translocating P-type ATPase [Treponema denticola]|uniref:heavy metal translocating P-type ATPase n=1 Tax=Treponema denticola TaxID=158 RepID=UPI0002B5B247|nr:heavy metal translocating P-type ATPase [Treponema denticola]EMB26177.1 heavy metal translocating P-type ATPase [Treponema denticola SP37]EPF34084.1 heavy metal translocating P-type ATPase [Treponema denticola SP44]EPF39203.1 heavy metal translocating P-type ATPase [Treponema denticola SP23]
MGKKIKFNITGMTCSACSSHVQRAVEKLEGAAEVQVNLLTNSMSVNYDEAILGTDKIIEAVEKAGYGASLADSLKNSSSNKNSAGGKTSGTRSFQNDAAKLERDKIKKRLILSLVFMIPLFYVSMGHMASLPIPHFLHGIENALIFSFTQFLLALPVLIINKKFFTGGFKAFLNKAPNMDSLVAVGSGAALIYGIFAIYKMAYGMGHGDMETVRLFAGDLYFESAAMILTLVTLGKFLEANAKGKTSQAITKLMNLKPKTALVIRNGNEEEIPVEEIVKGDLILIKPGFSIPVDGIIVEGNSSVDEAAITGESLPVEKTAGDKVVSASINLSGTFTFKAERVGDDTTLSQIIALVEEASASKAPVSKLADKISNYFVPAVIAIAVITLFVWFIAGEGFEFALSRAISVLVISCPCALGLATPTAIMAGTGKGARLGILIRSAEALETAHKTNTVVLDKTGTITQGRPDVIDIKKTENFSEDEVLSFAYSLEVLSEHPLANAVIKRAKEKNLEALKIKDFKAEHGFGISGIEEASGLKILAGNEKLFQKNNIEISHAKAEIDALAEKGATPLLIGVSGRTGGSSSETDTGAKLIGIIAVADKIKEGSIESIAEFKAMGIKTIMLTGDNKKTANAIKAQTGVDDFSAELLPQNKKNEIEKLQQAGLKTAMIGDGINDAPALMTADVGIAIGNGTDIAIESADIILMNDNLQTAVDSIQLSRAVMRNIKENLFWALFYNSLCIPLAAGVFYPLFGIVLSPMIAAAAMSLSSVSVVSNALRLNYFKPKRKYKISRDAGSTESCAADKNKIKEKELMNTVLKVNGMQCQHCVSHVKEALTKISGVSAEIDLGAKTATITHPESVSVADLKKAIEDAGYTVE